VDGLWATKSEGVGLIDRAISFQDFQPMWSWSTNVTDRRTDRQTDGQHAISIPRYALVDRAVIKRKQINFISVSFQTPAHVKRLNETEKTAKNNFEIYLIYVLWAQFIMRHGSLADYDNKTTQSWSHTVLFVCYSSEVILAKGCDAVMVASRLCLARY